MTEVKVGEILEPADEKTARRVRNGFWATLRRALASIPFAEDVVAGYYCAFDPATPARVKAVLLGALAYFVMPFDAIPDFLVGIGFTDDVTVLLGALALVGSNIRPEHRDAARKALDDGIHS